MSTSWSALTAGLNSSVLSAFGQDVVYTPVVDGLAGSPVTVKGIVETEQQAEDKSPGTYTVLFVRVSDLASSPATGDAASIGGVAYRVFQVELDGQGGARLALHLQ